MKQEQAQKCAVIISSSPEQASLLELSKGSVQGAINTNKGIFSDISTIFISVDEKEGVLNYSKARNKGVILAMEKGCDWVFFLDGGNVLSPKIFEVVSPYLSNYDAVWGQIYSYKRTSNEEFIAERLPKQLEWTENKKDILFVDPHLTIQIGHFVKTSIVMKNTFNEKIGTGAEFEYFLNIWDNRKSIKIPYPLYFTRHNKYMSCQKPDYNNLWLNSVSNSLNEYKNRKISNLYSNNTEKHKGKYMDFVIYGILRSGTTVLSDLLTVKDKSLVLYEPDILLTSYKNEKQDAEGHEAIYKSLNGFGIDSSEFKCWDKRKYPTFLQFFDKKIYPTLSKLQSWGVKLVRFDDWEGFLAAYQPQRLILSVRDIRDVVLSAYDLATKLNTLVFNELWIEKRVIDSCNQLVKMSKLPHFLVRYEDLCSNTCMQQNVSKYVGVDTLGEKISNFDNVVSYRKSEQEKHGGTISSLSISRYRSEPTSPALGLANYLWRLCPEYSETFGYEIPHLLNKRKSKSSNNYLARDTDLPGQISLGQSICNARTAALSTIPDRSVVLDLSCGTMSLEPMLPEKCKYIPCDVVKRDKRTLICNPNKGILPDFNGATIIVALGLLEYVTNISGFIKELRERYGLPVIISYHPLNKIPLDERTELGWLNHLSKSNLKLVLQNAGLNIEIEKQIDDTQILIIAKPNKVMY
jgi:hypothetical protein